MAAKAEEGKTRHARFVLACKRPGGKKIFAGTWLLSFSSSRVLHRHGILPQLPLPDRSANFLANGSAPLCI